ncbi:MAG TPA: hypothetical protein VGF59_24015 [Bryobacteraceae bacterium]
MLRSSLLLTAASLLAQDHVGKPVPEYLTGDECLFCHDVKIGRTWQTNPHAWTIRPKNVEPVVSGLPTDATHVLGNAPHARALKQAGYGKFAVRGAAGAWDSGVFPTRCAGCHATAVDPTTHAFSTSALDCYTCHGAVPTGHTENTALVWFSSKHEKPPRQIVAICGSCHLRGGKSRSSALPYANNFVAGDDLFADFQIDLKLADDPSLNPGDRHVYRNIRDVLERKSDATCLSCHRIHGDTSSKHRFVLASDSCLDCHNAEGPKKVVKKYEVHSATCQY